MNIFRSDKAPYVLGLLVTAIGWHVTQLVNEISTTQPVSYRVDINRQTGEISALIHNVSRTRSLVDATFALECPPQEDCFQPLSPPQEGVDPTYGRVRAYPPNGISRLTADDGPDAIVFTNTIAAGGRYQIIGRLANPETQVNFFYLPAPEGRPLDIYLYRKASISGFVLENYLGLLLGSLLACVAGLVYSLVWAPKPVRVEEEEADSA